MHHLIIGGMTNLSYWDGFLMVGNDLRLSSGHNLTKLLHCVVSQP